MQGSRENLSDKIKGDNQLCLDTHDLPISNLFGRFMLILPHLCGDPNLGFSEVFWPLNKIQDLLEIPDAGYT